MTIEKINKDIASAKAKIAELQKKIRSLEAQRTEEENLQIVKMVKMVNMDGKQLAAFLKAYAKGDIVLPKEYLEEQQEPKPNKPEQPAADKNNQNKQEDAKNEKK